MLARWGPEAGNRERNVLLLLRGRPRSGLLPHPSEQGSHRVTSGQSVGGGEGDREGQRTTWAPAEPCHPPHGPPVKHTHVCTRTHMNLHVHTCMHMYTHTNTHEHTGTRTRVHTHGTQSVLELTGDLADYSTEDRSLKPVFQTVLGRRSRCLASPLSPSDVYALAPRTRPRAPAAPCLLPWQRGEHRVHDEGAASRSCRAH